MYFRHDIMIKDYYPYSSCSKLLGQFKFAYVPERSRMLSRFCINSTMLLIPPIQAFCI